MNISIIIPNYNGEYLLKKNLPKVLESVSSFSGDIEIVITDDHSTDDSAGVIKKFMEENLKKNVKIKLIESSENKGFSTNVNRGVERSEGEILILLNTDVAPSKDFLEPLLKNFDNENVFAVGCLDESIEKGKTILRGRGVGEWKRGFLVHSKGDVDGQDTLWVSGGSGAFRKKLWAKLGGLDSLFDPFYWEDIDLSYRARKSGWATLFEKKSIVRHEHEKGIIKSGFRKNEIKKIAYRNQLIFVWKNSDFSTLIHHIFWLPYHLIKAVLTLDFEFIAGFILALIKLPKILKSRSTTKKQFVKSDKEVTSKFS